MKHVATRGPKPRDVDAVQFMRDRLVVLDSLRRLLRGQPDTLLPVRELRADAKLPKEAFDRAMLELQREDLVALHEHDFPSSLPPDKLAELVAGRRGRYFIGVGATPTLRRL